MKEKINWINYVKALCMIGVYLLHCQAFTNNSEYDGITLFIAPFYVNGFFFVSGFLFFRKWLNQTLITIYSIKKALANVFFRLFLPTIIFASLIYIPKHYFHHELISTFNYFYDVFGGISFWFTSAMVIAQFCLIASLASGFRSLFSFSIIGIFLIGLIFLAKILDPTPFPWYYKTGMAGAITMILGGWFYKFFAFFEKSKVSWPLILVVYGVLLWIQDQCNLGSWALMSVNVNLFGFLLSLFGIFSVIIIAQILPNFKFLQFIGENSIVFYFFSGVLPASFASLFNKLNLGYNPFWWVAFLSIISGFLISIFIVRYLSFLTDLRKLKISNHKKILL